MSFYPGAEFLNNDAKLFSELQVSLLEGNAIVWRHPFDHFHVGGFHPGVEGITIEDFIGNETLRCEFLEGPILKTMLGAEFELYSKTEMKDFVITNIEWEDESKEKAEVYIVDSTEKQRSLSRIYITKEQADKIREKNEIEKMKVTHVLSSFTDPNNYQTTDNGEPA